MNPGATEGIQIDPAEIQGESQTLSGHAQENVPTHQTSHMEAVPSPTVSPEDEKAAIDAAQQQVFEAMQQQAMQDVQHENPDAASAMVTPPLALQPEPTSGSILHEPPAKKSFLAGALTQVKDTLTQLFQGVKKMLFPTKGPKPPRPTVFKNLGREGGTPAVSFKSQPTSA
ncbi:MAG: hypothetical protein NTV98_04310 [Candidatus Roizmanbacteria bacterium]|nr:hypothetical protein [Candidatus Roizmanbacteria bacterium]